MTITRRKFFGLVGAAAVTPRMALIGREDAIYDYWVGIDRAMIEYQKEVTYHLIATSKLIEKCQMKRWERYPTG